MPIFGHSWRFMIPKNYASCQSEAFEANIVLWPISAGALDFWVCLFACQLIYAIDLKGCTQTNGQTDWWMLPRELPPCFAKTTHWINIKFPFFLRRVARQVPSMFSFGMMTTNMSNVRPILAWPGSSLAADAASAHYFHGFLKVSLWECSGPELIMRCICITS